MNNMGRFHMENTTTTNEENKIYTLAKEITQTQNSEQKHTLYKRLEELVKNTFVNSKQEEIDDAIQLAYENKEEDVASIIQNDMDGEIEHMVFEKDGKNYHSQMLLMPCTMLTSKQALELPSILSFQKTIQEHLLKANIISHPDEFQLGTIRIKDEEVETLTAQDWWNIHHNMVENRASQEEKDKLAFKSKVDIENNVSMFHLVPFITVEENKNLKHVLEKVTDNEKYGDIWDEISKELSNDNVGFELITPSSIYESMQNGKFMLQICQLEVLIHEYAEYDTMEMGYIKLGKDNEPTDTYVVFFFDSEDNALADFFVFETDGNEMELVNTLIYEIKEFNSQRLWHFDVSLSTDTLDNWIDVEDKNDDSMVFVTDLLKHGHTLDLKQVMMATEGNSGRYLH